MNRSKGFWLNACKTPDVLPLDFESGHASRLAVSVRDVGLESTCAPGLCLLSSVITSTRTRPGESTVSGGGREAHGEEPDRPCELSVGQLTAGYMSDEPSWSVSLPQLASGPTASSHHQGERPAVSLVCVRHGVLLWGRWYKAE